MTKFTI